MIHEVTGREALPVVLGTSGGPKNHGSTDAGNTTSNSVNVNEAERDQPAERSVLEAAVQKTQETLKHLDSSLKIEIDPDLRRVIVKVIDDRSGEVIRQIPAQEMLDIAKRLDVSQGLLFAKRT